MKHIIYLISCVFLLQALAIAPGAFAGQEQAHDLFFKNLPVKDKFEASTGKPVGKIRRIRGEVYIIHADKKAKYRARKGLPLYKLDIIVTMKNGHVSFSTNDGSFMTIAPNSRIEITKSFFDAKKKIRSTFMSMAMGKGRFVVKKLFKPKTSEFKVKTRTSVAGVRGSDFIIVAMADLTEITALEDTVLEVISLAAPEAPPLVLHDYERTIVAKGALPQEAKRVKAQDVERMIKEFMLQPPKGSEAMLREAPVVMEEKKEATSKPAEAPKAVPAIKVDERDLIAPAVEEEKVEKKFKAKGIDREEAAGIIRKIRELRRATIENKAEDTIEHNVVELPDFPELPN